VALLWTFWHALAAKTRAANGAMTQIISPGTGPQRVTPGQPGERIHMDETAKLEVLQEQGLSAAELRLLASYSNEERFPPEALIFGEGERGDKLYIVVDGQVRISRRLPGMGEEALAILKRGEVFGEMALIDDLPRSADARSHVEGCTVFTVDRQRLEEVLDMDPDAAHQFLTLLCQLLCRRLRAPGYRQDHPGLRLPARHRPDSARHVPGHPLYQPRPLRQRRVLLPRRQAGQRRPAG